MKLKYFRPLALVAVALSIICPPAGAGGAGLVVHEWGTFTSFQGGDGVLLGWQPFEASSLPGFVYNWSHPGSDCVFTGLPGFGGKISLFAKQRLETPVVYFYSDKEQTLDLTVKFPKGWITEWYPRADAVGRSNEEEGMIRWSNLRLLRSARLGNPAVSGDHYFAARETDSDCVKTKDEIEKFLFYRGAGNFGTPLRVTMKSDFAVTLTNTGNEPISHLFILEVNDKTGNFISLNNLKSGEARTIFNPSTQKRWFRAGDELAGAVGKSMAKALVHSGLYPREAEAMVRTWDDSWFRENGLRVFYVLPRTWTDGALPMTLNPTPRELVRVMVGRAEVFTPGAEQALIDQLNTAKHGDATAAAGVRKTLKALGRFASPALSHAMADAKVRPDEQGKLYTLLYGPSKIE